METTSEKIKSLNLCGMHSSKRQLLEALYVIAEAYVEMAEKMKWIPVTERLPEIGQRVLCSVTDKIRGNKVYIIINEYDNFPYWKDGTITAWMPLPEPYKEESR